MGFIRTAFAISVLGAGVSAQFDANRLQLDNGGDQLWILQDPFIGSDPANGQYDGDYYYKVLPESANQRCAGTFTWVGSQYPLFDDDWSTGAVLYDIVMSPATVNPDDTMVPDLGTSPNEIVLVGGPLSWEDLTGVPFNPASSGAGGDCPPPNFVTGFGLSETYVDTTGALLDPAFILPTGNWAVSNHLPDGQSATLPPVNACGGAGDVTLSWLGSTDVNDPAEGENQPDWTGNPGASAYGGFQVGAVGGGGAFIFEGIDGGAEFSVMMAEPTLNIRCDVGLEAAPFVEIGLAGLNPQIGISGGLPTGSNLSIGAMTFDESAGPVASGGIPFVQVVFTNVGPTLIDLAACVTIPGAITDLGLNPGDPVLTVVTSPSGINLFADGHDPALTAGTDNTDFDFDGDGALDGVGVGNLIPVSPSAGLVGIAVKWQAFSANALTSEAEGTNVLESTFR